MYTVIIAEKKHFDAIEQNKLYFKPFLDRLNKEFAFCEWNPEGKNLYECVPSLVKKVGRHATWRAVILKDDSLSLLQNPFDAIGYDRILECAEKNKLVNPLDETDIRDDVSSEEADFEVLSQESFEKWKNDCGERINARLRDNTEIFRDALSYPFQRLVTCLCFAPDGLQSNNPAEKHEAIDFFDKVLDRMNFEKYLLELDRLYHLEQDKLKSSLRAECLEQMLPGDGLTSKKSSMGIALPAEVFCFAERTTETGFFDDRVYWETHIGQEYSDFVGRNMYFDKMRFIASDILPNTHQNYRYDRIRFLYNLLLFSLNEVPGGAIQPRKLYCLESENNEKSLNSIVSAYVNKLNNSIELVDGQIEKIKRDVPKELSDSDAEKLFCAKVTVPVLPNEDFNEEDLYVDHKDYGFFSDSFGNDSSNWSAQTKRTSESVEKLAKQPRRALKKSIEKLERECDVDYNMIRAMNSFQMDDVRDHTETQKDKMVSTEVTNIFDLTRYHEEINKESENVSAVIGRRMKRKTNLVLGLICMLLFVVSFMPILLSNRATFNTVSTSLLFVLLFAGLLLVVLVITVILLRKPLKDALSDFNAKVGEIDNEVRDAMGKYSDYLSCVANVRRGYRVLNFSENNVDKYDRDIRIRKKHKTDMEKTRASILDMYEDFYDVNVVPDDLSSAPYPYDFGIENVEYEYYPPYLPDDRIFIDYLAPDNKIELSSDFVSKITLRMEEIYD